MKKLKKRRRVVIKEELVLLTGGYIPALILNQFIYWSERVDDATSFVEEELSRLRQSELTELSVDDLDLSRGWVYKKIEELNEELMLDMTKTTLGKYVNVLLEGGWLDRRRNPKYDFDKVYQYRVYQVKIQFDL